MLSDMLEALYFIKLLEDEQMRKIKIVNLCDKEPGFIGRNFVNAEETTEEIRCAYDLCHSCTPDCAACTIYGSFLKAMCGREGEGFNIGSLE
jgi:hypothetical protein